jgi:hypothetical protein
MLHLKLLTRASGWGIEITISGTRFGDAQGVVTFFDNIQADNIKRWSNTSIEVAVPRGIRSGPVTVTTADGTTSYGVYSEVGDFLNLNALIPTGVDRAAIAGVNGKLYVIGGYTEGGHSETGIM